MSSRIIDKDMNRKQSLIERAVDYIFKHGYTNATVGNIAKHAGVSKGIITYYFPKKNDMMDEIVDDLYAKGADFMSVYWKEDDPAPKMLEDYIRSSLHFAMFNKKQVNVVTQIFSNCRNEDGRLRYENVEPMYEPFIHLFQKGQKDHDFWGFSPKLMAMILRWVTDHMAIYLTKKEKSSSLEQEIDEVVRLFLKATEND
ncbi:DNA-binding transcriptional regulator, AcrR family [Evansella caseinilytica]|uniref:DNA-binding transcriptional regulator, AcrR family n=1 Tax=Evansella caseinilytica TaxID=1503961 RepID=A0A1H3Q4H3_9BACI|nr:TetR/AcrR family transcriptional regulator [Evansella caseinilytica]SDZ08008.1 DNA-binding transcriptional regulator, AcrR family [Evansella caseinilytica]